MEDVSGYFGKVWETREGWKANCPRCGDTEKKFYWNTEKNVGCCFHSDCSWFYLKAGVTSGRLVAFFTSQGVNYDAPEVIQDSEEADVSLPKEFRLIKDLKSELRNTLYSYLSHRHIPKGLVKKAKIGYCETGKRWGYMILPVFDNGEVVYWQGRRFKNREPKFYNPKSSRKSELVYSISSSKRPDKVVVVESIMNALTLESVGATKSVIVAILGKSLSDAQRDKILYMEKWVKELVIALDGDARRDTVELADKFKGIIPAVKIANIPDGEDINSLGREKAWELIWKAEVYDSSRRMEFMTREV